MIAEELARKLQWFDHTQMSDHDLDEITQAFAPLIRIAKAAKELQRWLTPSGEPKFGDPKKVFEEFNAALDEWKEP